MIYSKAMKCADRLDDWIADIKLKLSKYPPGEMYVSRNGKYFKWSFKENEGAKPVNIAKKNKAFAEKFAQKKLLQILLDDLMHERRAIEFYLHHHKERPWKSERLLAENPGYQELLLPTYRPLSEKLAEWAKESYPKCERDKEQLTVKIPDGSYVRSKSEALIAMVLFKYKIPFRYECALQLGEITYYPDFTIRHPRTGEVYYFEHFGMMDKKYYVQKACNKLEIYSLNGIVQSKNLITTFETKDSPLDVEYVELLVKFHLL